MGAVTLQPTGSAPVEDAARQSLFSAFFFASPNLLDGIDDSPRIVTGPGNGTDQLGPGTTLGVDVGVGNNGEVYVRGRTGQATSAQPVPPAATVAGVRITPAVLILGLVALALLAK